MESIENGFEIVTRRINNDTNTDNTNDDDYIFKFNQLVFQEQYLQFTLQKPNNIVASYGFGESSRLTQHLEEDTIYTLWNTDFPAASFNHSAYGFHPMVVQVTEDGLAHGVLFMNGYGMDVTMGESSIGLQAIGGIVDIYIFSGATPSEVVSQYLEVVGRPSLIPYWSLGFHNCRWGYESISEISEIVSNYSSAGIPLETQWFDIDYMDKYKDFTVDPINFPASGMKSFIDTLHENIQHFVPIVDPGIYAILEESDPYPALVQGLEQNVFIKDLNDDLYLGQVWPGATYFPDWFAKNISTYWTSQYVDFYGLLEYSGIWIDMNEVSNFCNANGLAQTCELDSHTDCDDGCCDIRCHTVDMSNKYDYPPYTPHVSQNSMGGKTLA